ncbi:MAG TPA: Yip1 family protein [Usitatibacter sp.]|nr:Yip1 family protein [Usitatibacter sp.]
MNLVERAKNLLLKPKDEWQAIAEENHTVQGLFTQYVMILAAIPAVAGFIGLSIVGIGIFGGSYRVPITTGIAHMVVTYVLSLGFVYAVALVIDGLAGRFEAEKDFMQSLKVAAFAPTAGWLAGIFQIVPALSILAVLGSLYSLYLLYLGIGALKHPPQEQAVSYTVIVVIVVVVMAVVVGAISALAIPSPVRGF